LNYVHQRTSEKSPSLSIFSKFHRKRTKFKKKQSARVIKSNIFNYKVRLLSKQIKEREDSGSNFIAIYETRKVIHTTKLNFDSKIICKLIDGFSPLQEES
jgi:hypothetical protein